MDSFSQEEISNFLFFISGSSRIPYGGLKRKIVFFRSGYEISTSLPIAHTCTYQLDIPTYESKEVFKEKLLLAMYEGKNEFYQY